MLDDKEKKERRQEPRWRVIDGGLEKDPLVGPPAKPTLSRDHDGFPSSFDSSPPDGFGNPMFDLSPEEELELEMMAKEMADAIEDGRML